MQLSNTTVSFLFCLSQELTFAGELRVTAATGEIGSRRRFPNASVPPAYAAVPNTRKYRKGLSGLWDRRNNSKKEPLRFSLNRKLESRENHRLYHSLDASN